MADGYDFQIDTLKFRAAISDQFPYSRTTAPFRKEQFDASATVGDQSLTGWWTRGQFSFHKGLGIKYYEILDGEGVLNRAFNSSGIDGWTAGKVTLAMDAIELNNITTPIDATWLELQGAAHTASGLFTIAFRLASPNTVAFKGTTQITTTTAGANSVGAICVVPTTSPETVLISVGSKIEKMAANITTSTVLWNVDDVPSVSGPYIRRMFWAKNRAWVVNSDGRWYTLDTVGGTVPSGGGTYKFWDSPDTAADGVADYAFSFAESPGAVFMARGRYIWATTVNEDGTIATPYVVADLGPNAVINCIAVHRGRLGISTTTGFCVAEILGEDGTLIVGPIYIKHPATTTRSMTTYGDFLYFLAVHPDDEFSSSVNQSDYSVYEVNMTDDVTELQPAYVVRQRAINDGNGSSVGFCVPTTQPNLKGAAVVVSSKFNPARVVLARDALGTYQDDGYLVTGQHRFGTLEKKQFYSIAVTVESTSTDTTQRIEVFRVDKDGIETALTNGTRDGVAVTTARNGVTIFDLSTTDPVESMGFKFKLYKGLDFAYYTPTLLGYQIKALPVPQRQRILKWPLAIQDLSQLRRGTGVGRPGQAYTDVKALEALESSRAIVTFTDHRTGETGKAYIDSVELQTDTPSTATTNGFGGVAYVALRVLS